MSIVKRLVITLLAALLALLLVTGLGLWNLGQAQNRFEHIGSNVLPALNKLNEIKDALSSARLFTYQHTVIRDPAVKAQAEKQVNGADALLEKALEQYARELVADDEERRMVSELREFIGRYGVMRKELLAFSNAGNDAEVTRILKTTGATMGREYNQRLEDLIKHNNKLASDHVAANQQAYRNSVLLALGVTLAALIVCSLFAVQLFHLIRSGLAEMQGTMKTIAASLDFTRRTQNQRNDEIGQTAQAFNALLDKLQQSLRSLSEDARGVASGAQQLNQSAAQVAQAATAQSDSSSAMAATIEQVTVSINHVAERAGEAQQLSEDSVQLADSGSRIIAQTIADIRRISTLVREAGETIRELEAHSDQVGNIVQVIREVADQTNLLALNAAIEAARAGEQGRGFAVVADEVRKLAERTTASTQEISGTISAMRQSSETATLRMQSVEQLVGQSEQRADDADQAIAKIGQSAGVAAHTVQEISGAIREQGSASNDIAVRVEGIARMAEEASVAARQAAEAANQLERQADRQIKTLQQYTL